MICGIRQSDDKPIFIVGRSNVLPIPDQPRIHKIGIFANEDIPPNRLFFMDGFYLFADTLTAKDQMYAYNHPRDSTIAEPLVYVADNPYRPNAAMSVIQFATSQLYFDPLLTDLQYLHEYTGQDYQQFTHRLVLLDSPSGCSQSPYGWVNPNWVCRGTEIVLQMTMSQKRCQLALPTHYTSQLDVKISRNERARRTKLISASKYSRFDEYQLLHERSLLEPDGLKNNLDLRICYDDYARGYSRVPFDEIRLHKFYDDSWVAKVTTKPKKITRQDGIPLTGDNGAWEVSQRANNPSRFISGDYRTLADKALAVTYHAIWKKWYDAERKWIEDSSDSNDCKSRLFILVMHILTAMLP